MPTWSLCEARCTWSRFSSRTTAHHWNFVGNSADGVKDQVIYDKCGPWADHDEAKYQLRRRISMTSDIKYACPRTNTRVSHVSMVEKLAGRIDNNPIVCSSKMH